MVHRKKFRVAWYWNLRFLFPSTYRSTTHGVSREQSSFKKMYQVLFFNATHQVKAIAIEVSEANPLVEIVSVFLFLSLNTYGNTVSANYIKRGIHPYLVSLYCNYFSLRYCVWQLHKCNFLVSIDHDNGIIKHIMGHFADTQRQFNDWYLIYRYRYRGR